MLTVRRQLTEILLEVTNEEIINIAKESINRYKKKGNKHNVHKYLIFSIC